MSDFQIGVDDVLIVVNFVGCVVIDFLVVIYYYNVV